MEESNDRKRKSGKYSDKDDTYKDRRYKKQRSRSRSPRRRRDNSERDSNRKRNYSRSRSPKDGNEEKRSDPKNVIQEKNDVPQRKTKETDMLNTRTGGAYIPPARLRMMQAQITDKSSVAYQRLAWEALKKSIHGHINKINVGNIGIIIKELLKENIVRGRGLLCRSVIQAQAASPTFTNVYAALVAAVNSRFPNIGELLLKRLVIQFKRGFKRNDKPTCISSASFIAHLVNQRVAHEILALELLTLLVESPTDDSVEVAIAFLKECGLKLTEVSSKGVNAIFEMLRNILHEGQLDKRVQYMIEVMFQVWKDGFKDHPAVIEELELVPEEEQFTHLLMLDEATDSQDILNVFKFDEKYEDNEQKYKGLSKEILGSDAETGEEGSDESGSDESDEEEEENKPVTIIDNTETNLVALRRTIYLTINSSLDFEECAHKLMKMQLKPGQEVELCHMFLDCCAEQRTYEKFYGLLAQRFCNINRIYIGPFEEIFKDSYTTAHRLDTNRLRNVSKFFAHLLFTDSISWEVMECVKLNEEDTTSSSRIYIKILFQELAEYMGLKKLNDRLKDPTLQDVFSGVFPRDNPKNTRFSINFFTSIGLGGLTDELREHLKQMPKNVPAPVAEIKLDSESSSDSSSSSSSSSSSDSSSSDSDESEKDKNTKKNKKSKNTMSPKTTKSAPEPNPRCEDKSERWGHDGFYERYGDTVVEPNRNNTTHNNRGRNDGNDRHYNSSKSRRGGSEQRDRDDMTKNKRHDRDEIHIRDTDSSQRYRRRDVSQERTREQRVEDSISKNQIIDKTYRNTKDQESNRQNDNDRSRKRGSFEGKNREHLHDVSRYTDRREIGANNDSNKRYRKDASREQETKQNNDERSKHRRENDRVGDLDRKSRDSHNHHERQDVNHIKDTNNLESDNSRKKKRDISQERDRDERTNESKSNHKRIDDRYTRDKDRNDKYSNRKRDPSQERINKHQTNRHIGSSKEEGRIDKDKRRQCEDHNKSRNNNKKYDDEKQTKKQLDRDNNEKSDNFLYPKKSVDVKDSEKYCENKDKQQHGKNKTDFFLYPNEEEATSLRNKEVKKTKKSKHDKSSSESSDSNSSDNTEIDGFDIQGPTKNKKKVNDKKSNNKKSHKSKQNKSTSESSDSESSDEKQSDGFTIESHKKAKESMYHENRTEKSRDSSEPPVLGRYWDSHKNKDGP
ncbi:pre-mRNA-splicing factor CWC22 homolog [Leptidea sinapis]|uniref:pre-mRNA-splicing factor CWC22 homolog n=1 Tax=Leptidea sinapis TaxID=189913 RepID=UPI0021298FCE|nr:pre-mRNA-splicing factor CWC22 homolog [Leptidea sinapis]